MKLICYIDSNDTLIKLNEEYTIEYNKNLKELEINKEKNDLLNFYGKNLSINVLAGKNGVGKTHILANIFKKSENNTFFLFRDADDVYYSFGNKEIECNLDGNEMNIGQIDLNDIKVDTIFYSNSLEGKNKNYFPNVHNNLSLLTKISNEPYSVIQTLDIIKQIKMINYLKLRKLDLLTSIEKFFEVPDEIELNINIEEEVNSLDNTLIDTIVLKNEKSEFVSFFENKNVELEKKIIFNFVKTSFLEDLMSIGLSMKSIWIILRSISKETKLLEKIKETISFESMEYNDTFAEKIKDYNFASTKSINFFIDFFDIDEESEILDYTNLDRIISIICKYEMSLKIISYFDLKKLNKVNGNLTKIVSLKEDKELISLLMFRHDYILKEIYWNRISSGQSYLLNFLSEIFNYHMNIPSENSTLLCIDEVDLGLHPEWQRKWINFMPSIIYQILNLDGKERHVNIILTTHAPILLSDIKNEDITFLGNDNRESSETFSQNIQTLYSNNFFLEETIGLFSKNRISNLVNVLTTIEEQIAEKTINSKEQRELSKTLLPELDFDKNIKSLNCFEKELKKNELVMNNNYSNLNRIVFRYRAKKFFGYSSDEIDNEDLLIQLKNYIDVIGEDFYRGYLKRKFVEIEAILMTDTLKIKELFKNVNADEIEIIRKEIEKWNEKKGIK